MAAADDVVAGGRNRDLSSASGTDAHYFDYRADLSMRRRCGGLARVAGRARHDY